MIRDCGCGSLTVTVNDWFRIVAVLIVYVTVSYN